MSAPPSSIASRSETLARATLATIPAIAPTYAIRAPRRNALPTRSGPSSSVSQASYAPPKNAAPAPHTA